MNFVSGNKIGRLLNVIINGNSYTKRFDSDTEALRVFKLVVKASENPTDEIIEELKSNMYVPVYRPLNHIVSVDYNTNTYFYKNTTFELPKDLVDVINDYIEHDLPIASIENFTELLITNPNKEVHSDLFKFLHTYNFSITKYGYFIAYKAVKVKHKVDNDLAEFVSNNYLKIKSWKKSPNNYSVIRDINGKLFLFKNSDIHNSSSDATKFVVGNLNEMFNNLDKYSLNGTLYTDKYTGTMDIRLGIPVKIDREECDPHSNIECSRGLHVGSVKYLENNNYVSDSDTILLVLVNPQHVIAVPKYDNSKLRVCEYFPISILNRIGNRKFETVETKYFEYDYLDYERSELEKTLSRFEDKNSYDTSISIEQKSINEILINRYNKINIK